MNDDKKILVFWTDCLQVYNIITSINNPKGTIISTDIMVPKASLLVLILLYQSLSTHTFTKSRIMVLAPVSLLWKISEENR
jgi:hypothetical protein